MHKKNWGKEARWDQPSPRLWLAGSPLHLIVIARIPQPRETRQSRRISNPYSQTSGIEDVGHSFGTEWGLFDHVSAFTLSLPSTFDIRLLTNIPISAVVFMDEAFEFGFIVIIDLETDEVEPYIMERILL